MSDELRIKQLTFELVYGQIGSRDLRVLEAYIADGWTIAGISPTVFETSTELRMATGPQSHATKLFVLLQR